MDHLSKDNALWLLGDYNKIRGYGKVSNHIDAHIKAMSLIRNTQYNKPSCSCEWAAYAQMANSMYEQNLEQIKIAAGVEETQE
jgi:DNA-binding IscR family transcriptional regulator